MESLPTYYISYYNACKSLLIALQWDLSIFISTADRFEPSIGVLLILLSLVAASAILVSPKSSSSSNISLELLNYCIFLNVL